MKLIDALKIAKSMKRSIMYITRNYILGADESFSTLSLVTLENDVIEDLSRDIAISGFLTDDTREKFISSDPVHWFNYYEKVGEGVYIDRFPEAKYKVAILALYRKCTEFDNTSVPIFYNANVRLDNQFEQVNELKSADGMDYYRINNNTIQLSTFASLHPLTKTDKMSLECKQIDSYSFLAKFIIDKKKYRIVEFIRYRFL